MEKIRHIKHLNIASIDEGTLELALGYSKMYGFLSNDAFYLATMKQKGISTMASNDRDLEGIEWINLWRP
jgi:predicted nucleic acid-binding protein